MRDLLDQLEREPWDALVDGEDWIAHVTHRSTFRAAGGKDSCPDNVPRPDADSVGAVCEVVMEPVGNKDKV